MAVTNGWGQGVDNNAIEWGRGSSNATNDWGYSQTASEAGDTVIHYTP